MHGNQAVYVLRADRDLPGINQGARVVLYLYMRNNILANAQLDLAIYRFDR